MSFLTGALALVLSFFSTAIMSYIAMATGLGPWIEATLVLVGMLIVSLFKNSLSLTARTRTLGLTTAAGGIGGILATACGFSFPTLYFIDNASFNSLLNTPLSFALLLTSLAFSAGSLGLVFASLCEPSLIEQETLPFPIGELVYKMIAIQDSMSKALSLAAGFIGTQLFLIIRTFGGFISRQFLLIHKYSFGFTTIPQVAVQTDQLPMFLAIGFVTGHVIAIPLLAGFLATILCIEPLHYFYPYIGAFFSSFGIAKFLPISPGLSLKDFTIAFCSGLVVYGAFMSFLELPKLLRAVSQKFVHAHKERTLSSNIPWLLIGFTLVINAVFLMMTHFSLLAALYLIVFTLICTYQMMLIAGKIGRLPWVVLRRLLWFRVCSSLALHPCK